MKTFFLNQWKLIFLAFAFSAFTFFLNSNQVYSIGFSLLSFILSLLAIYYYDKIQRKRNIKLSAYSFLAVFFSELESGFSLQEAYTSACPYLEGYQERKSFEEVCTSKGSCYSLYGYADYFAYAVTAFLNNAVTLLDNRIIRDELNGKVKAREKAKRDEEKEFKYCVLTLLIFLLLVYLIGLLSAAFKERVNAGLYPLFSGLIFSLLFPVLLFSRAMREEKK